MQLDVKSTGNRNIIDFRKAGYRDLCVLGRYKYNKTEKSLKEHVHEGMIEICYCDKGSQLLLVNGVKYLVHGGDVFINFPGEIHGSGDMPEEKGCLYWLIIKTSNIQGNADGLICANVDYLLHTLIKKGIRHFKGGYECKKILESIFKKSTLIENKAINSIRTELLIQNFLMLLLDKVSVINQESIDKRLNIIMNYITGNLTEYISIESLANSIHLSQSRFKIWFKQNTGFTPVDYIQRQRILQAIETIKEHPDISLSNLAYSLNFSTPQYFSTVMKKYTGKTPTQIKLDNL